ncbi:MAG: glycosyltransferase family 2 protein [Bacillota bacterium]|nr:glycosyltransferase family 2 protein [Bacillota bacterium]
MNYEICVSIILVNWNTKELLKNCINSIIAETKKISYEIIVVDNNSTDGSLEMIEKQFIDKIVLIKNHENRGFAAANNQALKIAKGQFILMLNSDTIVLDNAVEKTINYLKNDTRIGLAGCKLLNADNTLQYSCYNFNSIIRAFLFKTKFIEFISKSTRYKYEGLITSFDYNENIEVDYVCGAYMLFSREVYEKVGLLDENFFMYAEEADFCSRIKKNGYKVMFFSQASIIHYGGGSSKRINIISENRRIISRLLFIKKQKGTLYYHLYKIFSIFIVLMNIFRYSLTRNKELTLEYKSKFSSIISMKYE